MFIAGSYNLHLGVKSDEIYEVGHTDNGFNLNVRMEGDDIRCDAFGEGIVDGVYRGANATIDFVLSEYDAPGTRQRWSASGADDDNSQQNILWPFGGESVDNTTVLYNTMDLGKLGTLGRLHSEVSFYMKLVRNTGNALDEIAGATAPDILIAENAVVPSGFSISWLMANRHRKIPMQLRLLPYLIASSWYLFKTSATP